MALIERVYSVLVVSAAERFNSALTSLLPESRYDPVQTVSSVGAAKRLLSQRSFDFVLINSPLPDDSGINLAVDISSSREAVVLLLVKNEIHDAINGRVSEYGAFTLPKPVTKTVMSQALGWMISAREQLRGFEKKTLSIEEKMQEIRLVNRAKWLLIGNQGMDEPQAHRYIEKQAMDRCVSRQVIAEEIVKKYK
ncbi:MAG: ANTAR domain-containing protein [Clostridia bacterium]|nr:ANTAR domain-containing protein [Clostridia bacterium]